MRPGGLRLELGDAGEGVDRVDHDEQVPGEGEELPGDAQDVGGDAGVGEESKRRVSTVGVAAQLEYQITYIS